MWKSVKVFNYHKIMCQNYDNTTFKDEIVKKESSMIEMKEKIKGLKSEKFTISQVNEC
jgi:hypothetical protein